MTVFYGPKDLREVDPRPAPSLAAEEAIVRSMFEARLTGDELTVTLQMLGLLPDERELLPWKKQSRPRMPRPTIEAARDGSTSCKRGHLRSEYSFLDPRGRVRCRKCHLMMTNDSKRRLRENQG